MHLEVRSANVLFKFERKQYLERRLAFALGRFQDQVRRVAVHLRDSNGPRGGLDKHCLMVAKLTRGDEVMIEARASTTEDAIDDAADRLGHTLGRRLSRQRTIRRRFRFFVPN